MDIIGRRCMLITSGELNIAVCFRITFHLSWVRMNYRIEQ